VLSLFRDAVRELERCAWWLDPRLRARVAQGSSSESHTRAEQPSTVAAVAAAMNAPSPGTAVAPEPPHYPTMASPDRRVHPH
jgi:hypothetical protein